MGIFDKYPEVFIQYNQKESPVFDHAIVVVVGRPLISPLRDYLKKMKSAIVIMTGDEECAFECEKAIPKHFEMWTQCYAPHRSYMKERLLLGPPNRLVNYKINKHLPKKYLWSFIGQNQNPFRNKCVDVLKELPDGFLHVADGFGGGSDGIEYQEYLDVLCQSKYVVCPSGSFTADCFRVYEAILCGAIPICDRRSPRDAEDFNYWNEVYPEHNLITIDDWGLLPNYINDLENIKESFSQCDWWETYKQEVEQKLLNFTK